MILAYLVGECITEPDRRAGPNGDERCGSTFGGCSVRDGGFCRREVCRGAGPP